MGMTVPQKKYFIGRIDEILALKVNSIRNEQLSQEQPDDIADFKVALNDGTLTLVDTKVLKKTVTEFLKYKLAHYQSFHAGTSIALGDIVGNLDKWFESREWARRELNEEIEKKAERATQEATKIKDVAMFGNEQEAHEMLRKFGEMSFG